MMYNHNIFNNTVGLAQMVRASDCGPEGRRFDPDIPPHKKCECSTAVSIQVFQTWDEGSTPSTRTIFYFLIEIPALFGTIILLASAAVVGVAACCSGGV